MQAIHRRSGAAQVLIPAFLVEVAMAIGLVAAGRDAFLMFVSTPDTSSYVSLALRFIDGITVTDGVRTVGYPLFLVPPYWLGGVTYGPYLVIAIQMLLNLALTWGCWRLLERMVPDSSAATRTLATVFFFGAGLGMALYLMSDFLAALLLFVFLYGCLFWRSGTGTLLTGLSLALATLTRPTFTLFLVLIPVIGWLVRRCTSKIPTRDLVAYMMFSMAATAISISYQYTYYGYLGPSPNVAQPIKETLYFGVVRPSEPQVDYELFRTRFEADVERRAGRTYSALSPGERDMYAREIFRDQWRIHPKQIVTNYLMNFFKYIFAPIESIPLRIAELYVGEDGYMRYVRPVVGVICLPIWLLSLLPPTAAPRNQKAFYLLVMICLFYIVALSAIGSGQGERYRFPVLAFMLPIAVRNLASLQTLVATWRRRRGQTTLVAGGA
jgi:hypothetical protein